MWLLLLTSLHVPSRCTDRCIIASSVGLDVGDSTTCTGIACPWEGRHKEHCACSLGMELEAKESSGRMGTACLLRFPVSTSQEQEYKNAPMAAPQVVDGFISAYAIGALAPAGCSGTPPPKKTVRDKIKQVASYQVRAVHAACRWCLSRRPGSASRDA